MEMVINLHYTEDFKSRSPSLTYPSLSEVSAPWVSVSYNEVRFFVILDFQYSQKIKIEALQYDKSFKTFDCIIKTALIISL